MVQTSNFSRSNEETFFVQSSVRNATRIYTSICRSLIHRSTSSILILFVPLGGRERKLQIKRRITTRKCRRSSLRECNRRINPIGISVSSNRTNTWLVITRGITVEQSKSDCFGVDVIRITCEQVAESSCRSLFRACPNRRYDNRD